MKYKQIHLQNLCSKCSQVITNPVCERCYTKEIEEWFRDVKVSGIHKRMVLNKLKKEFSDENINEDTCVLCGNETLSTCSYCFFLAVARVLKELNFPDKIAKEFLDVFNYRHGHDEYHL